MTPAETLLAQAKNIALSLGIDVYILDDRIYQKDPGGGTRIPAPKGYDTAHGAVQTMASAEQK